MRRFVQDGKQQQALVRPGVFDATRDCLLAYVRLDVNQSSAGTAPGLSAAPISERLESCHAAVVFFRGAGSPGGIPLSRQSSKPRPTASCVAASAPPPSGWRARGTQAQIVNVLAWLQPLTKWSLGKTRADSVVGAEAAAVPRPVVAPTAQSHVEQTGDARYEVLRCAWTSMAPPASCRSGGSRFSSRALLCSRVDHSPARRVPVDSRSGRVLPSQFLSFKRYHCCRV